MRFAALVVAIAFCALTAAAAPALADWTGVGGGPAHLSRSAEPIGGNLYLRWKTSLGAPVQSEPILVGERLFASSIRGRVHALSSRTGDVLWTFTAGGEVRGTLAFDSGIVYAVTFTGQIHALDPTTGRELWRAEAGERVIGSPVAADGKLFVALTNGEVVAYRASSGQQLWRGAVDDLIHATPVYSDGRVFALTVGGSVAGFDAATGERLWVVKLRGTFGREQTGAVAGGKLIVTPNGNWRGGIFALDPETGRELWRWIFWEEENHWSAPAITDGTVYVGNEGGIAALDLETGKLRWYRETARLWQRDRWYKPVMMQPIVAPNRLMAAGYWYHEEGPPRLYAVSRETGYVTETLDVPGQFMSGIAALQGSLYYGSKDGHVYAWGNLSIVVHGKPVTFGYGVEPAIHGNITWLPLRTMAEAVGAHLEWDAATRTATLKRGWSKVEITLDRDTALVNGQPVTLPAKPLIINDRALLPVRFIVESLGGTLRWVPGELRIEIDLPQPEPTI
jgi:eukaryotic-like serine/threonine-protein kinase